MRKIITGGIALATAVGTALAGGALAAGSSGGQPQAWVNGGGQVVADSNQNGGGPGDTIAFNAQDLGNSTYRGQVQFIGRGVTGTPGTKYHGTVTCVQVSGDHANGGTSIIDSYDASTNSHLDLQVADSGVGNQGTDAIMFVYGSGPSQNDCNSNEFQNSNSFALARGNVSTHTRS